MGRNLDFNLSQRLKYRERPDLVGWRNPRIPASAGLIRRDTTQPVDRNAVRRLLLPLRPAGNHIPPRTWCRPARSRRTHAPDSRPLRTRPHQPPTKIVCGSDVAGRHTTKTQTGTGRGEAPGQLPVGAVRVGTDYLYYSKDEGARAQDRSIAGPKEYPAGAREPSPIRRFDRCTV
jgi:hypothetical protein